MPSTFDPTSDLSAMTDGAQAITLRRRGSSQKVAIATAVLTRDKVIEAVASAGRVVRAEATWHFTLPVSESAPRLGDVLEATDGRRWTVQEVERIVLGTRFRCRCVDVSIAFALCDRVDIQVAEWDTSTPPVITGWSELAFGIAARIQPIETSVPIKTLSPTSTTQFKIYLAEDWQLNHNHRLVGPDGAIYTIEQYEQSERIDVLPFATVVKDAV